MDPEQYIQGNHIQRKDAEELISDYIHLVNWRHSEDEIVLDVGCGTGDITCEMLKQRLPQGTRLIGADKSQRMVDYATRRYPDTEFMVFDIRMNMEKLQNTFDHVFSFHCLQWVQDQRQAIQNLYNLLKPGGDMFLYYPTHFPFFNEYAKMAKMDMWKNYMPDLLKDYLPNQHDKNPVLILRTLLEEVGFKVSICIGKERKQKLPNLKYVTKFLLGINRYYANIPQELKQQFSEDITRLFINFKETTELNQSLSAEAIINYNIVIIFATKPEIESM